MPVISNGGYLIVTGNFENNSTNYGGSFTSTRDPSHVFIGGTVPVISDSAYPVLNCSDTTDIHYTYSNCIYGNGTDLMNDPIYNFFFSLCAQVEATSNSPVCEGDTIKLNASMNSASTDAFSFAWFGPGGFSGEGQNIDLVGNSSAPGLYQVTISSSNGCTDTATTIVVVNMYPVADAGPDQILNNVQETSMNALPLTSELNGEWSLVSGAGNIAEIQSPTSSITGLHTGENIFMWTVRNGNCSDADEVVISKNDLFIPSVITPNGDGMNDLFQISGTQDKTELVIFNRWGIIEYSSENYLNEWDGRNNSNNQLDEDTYFYIVKFSNGNIQKGSVLIKR
jgi:gliding motility-associated-like protein